MRTLSKTQKPIQRVETAPSAQSVDYNGSISHRGWVLIGAGLASVAFWTLSLSLVI